MNGDVLMGPRKLRVALSLDDCALAGGLEWALDLLKSAGARATCFPSTGFLHEAAMRVEPDVDRLARLWSRMLADGHEVGCHGHWHVDGSAHTREQWLDDALQALALWPHTFAAGGDGEADALNVHGFRAPKLGVNSWMWPALAEAGFMYDSSLVVPASDLFQALDMEFCGVRELAMTCLPAAGLAGKSEIPPLDFNWWVSLGMTGDQVRRTVETEVERRLDGSDAERPLLLVLHPDMYDVRYARAGSCREDLDARRATVERLVLDLAGMPEVECVTHGELFQVVDSGGASHE